MSKTGDAKNAQDNADYKRAYDDARESGVRGLADILTETFDRPSDATLAGRADGTRDRHEHGAVAQPSIFDSSSDPGSSNRAASLDESDRSQYGDERQREDEHEDYQTDDMSGLYDDDEDYDPAPQRPQRRVLPPENLKPSRPETAQFFLEALQRATDITWDSMEYCLTLVGGNEYQSRDNMVMCVDRGEHGVPVRVLTIEYSHNDSTARGLRQAQLAGLSLSRPDDIVTLERTENGYLYQCTRPIK